MRRKSSILSGILFVVILIVYIPFVIGGGFGPSDDLALVYNSDAGFGSLLSSFITSESQASRPLSSIIYSIVFSIFGESPRPYIVLQLSIWFASIVILSKIVKLFLGEISAVLFIFLGAMPIFSSAVIFSSYLISYTLSILLWAISLILILKYVISGSRSHYWLSYFFLTSGLFFIEIILPLLLMNILLPLIIEQNRKTKETDMKKMIGLKYIYPIVFIMVIFFVFKVFITNIYISPSENSNIYGLSLSAKSILQSIYYFFALIIEIPIMLIETIPFLINPSILITSILISTFSCYLLFNKNIILTQRFSTNDNKIARQFINLSKFGIICCPIIFILSGYPAVTFGHYNKMMIPTQILVTILISWYLGKILNRSQIILPIVLLILWSSSMIIQIEGFIDSWEIRKSVLSDCSEKLNAADLGKNPYLIASVPFFTQNNYNNEHVFWLSWDFSSGLKLFGLDKLLSPFPFCWQTLTNKDYYPLHNINRFLSELPQDANIWFYEYEIKSRKSEFRRLINVDDLDRQLTVLESAKTNYHRIILRQRVRMKIKTLAKKFGFV
tara:strand:+ start:200 stop:1870 length:1671 start_codon:yes stop_codon:yes gene_type:complete